MKTIVFLLTSVLLPACASAPAEPVRPPPVATFSIVARDARTGDLGIAVQSKFLAVGAVVPWARAGVGAIATQAWANTTWGPDGLALLESGLAPEKALETLLAKDEGREFRQVGIVDARGRTAAFTGKEAMAWAGHVEGEGYTCQGNILAGEDVVKAMAEAFEASEDPLPERLVAALAAGERAGGDRRGRQSAALLVVRAGGGYSGWNDRMVDLRVDDHVKPIEELARLLALHRKTFGTASLPAEREGYEKEPSPEAGSLATPRGSWETFVTRFRARDYPGLYRLQTSRYRKETSLEAFSSDLQSRYSEIESFLGRVTYAGTRIDGEKAKVALASPGSPRPILIDLVLENGEWRFPD